MEPAHSGLAGSAPVFIVGSGRSGTSLLRAMLVAHPAVHLAQEAMFFPWTRAATPWESADRRLDRWLASFSFAWLRLDLGEVRRRFPPPLPAARLPEVYGWVLRELAARHGATRWGDKTPPNSLYLREIFGAFPDARVILVVRDPRDVVLSLETSPFTAGSRTALLLLGRAMRRRMAPWMERLHVVRLEDLAGNPAATMSRVLEFVGEPWDDAVLAHHERVPADDPPYPWTRGASQPLRACRPRWPAEMEPSWVRIVERLAAGSMAPRGYAPADLPEEPSRGAMARAVLADLPEAVRFAGRAARVYGRLWRRTPAGPAETQRRVLSLNPRVREAHPDWTMPDPPSTP
ncbi:MAG TPA: sulfotransferase [Gemmatimonadota bacterium]|nr:sulfotransferase [Gemmatimonadota bacterium]